MNHLVVGLQHKTGRPFGDIARYFLPAILVLMGLFAIGFLYWVFRESSG